MKTLTESAAVLVLALTLGACADSGLTPRQQNAAIGAAVGGVAGNLIGNSTGATLGGAALGGLVGSQISR